VTTWAGQVTFKKVPNFPWFCLLISAESYHRHPSLGVKALKVALDNESNFWSYPFIIIARNKCILNHCLQVWQFKLWKGVDNVEKIAVVVAVKLCGKIDTDMDADMDTDVNYFHVHVHAHFHPTWTRALTWPRKRKRTRAWPRTPTGTQTWT
jgi:hypothetical protein